MPPSGRQYYTLGDYARRATWALVWPLFRFSPRLLPGWRNFLLRALGADIGPGAILFPTAVVTFPWKLRIGRGSVVSWEARLYNLETLEIGDRVVISQNAHLCGGTHDFESEGFRLVKSQIWIEDDVWIAADAFVGPGVRIGRGAVVGARAVVVKDIPPHAVVVGNPARIVRIRAPGRR